MTTTCFNHRVEGSSFLFRRAVGSERLDLFGALILRNFDDEKELYISADFTLSLPALKLHDDNSAYEEGPEIFHSESIHGKHSNNESISAPKAVDIKVEILESKESNSESEIARCLLVGLLGIESNILNIRIIPKFVGEANRLFGTNLQVIQGLINKFREIFIQRSLLNAFQTAILHSDDVISPCCKALLTGVQLVLHLVDTSLLTITQAYGFYDSNDRFEKLLNLWEATCLHRSIILQLLYAVSPPSLLHCLNTSKMRRKASYHEISIESFTTSSIRTLEKELARYFTSVPWLEHYHKDGPLGSGWAIFERHLTAFSQQRLVPWIQSNTLSDIDQLSRENEWLSLESDYFHLIVSCHLLQSVSEPFMNMVYSRIYRVQPLAFSNGLSLDWEGYLSVSFDSVWNSSIEQGESSIIEQLLAACAWAESRIALLQSKGSPLSDQGQLGATDRATARAAAEESRRLIRDCLVKPFDQQTSLTFPVTEEAEIRWNQARVKSASIMNTFRRDLIKLIRHWIKPIRESVHEEVVADIPVSEALNLSSLSEDDDLQLAPLHLNAHSTISETNNTNEVTEDNKGEDDGALYSYFYSSPLNIQRQVDRSLVLEAKERITAHYEKQMDEVEARKAKAAWQVQRLKGMQQSRQLLRDLLESELAQLRSEKEERDAQISTESNWHVVGRDADKDSSDHINSGEIELSNESRFIDSEELNAVAIDGNLEMELDISRQAPSTPVPMMETAQSLIYGGGYAFHRAETSSAKNMRKKISFSTADSSQVEESAQSLIYGGFADINSKAIVPSVKVSQSSGGNSTISLSHTESASTVEFPSSSGRKEKELETAQSLIYVNFMDSKTEIHSDNDSKLPESQLLSLEDNSTIPSGDDSVHQLQEAEAPAAGITSEKGETNSKSSVRVIQSPGGISNMDLSHHASQSDIRPDSDMRVEAAEVDNLTMESISEVDIDEHFLATLKLRKEAQKLNSIDMDYENIIREVLTADLGGIEAEEATRETLTSLSASLSLLGVSQGIIELKVDKAEGSSSSPEVTAEEASLALKPLPAVIDRHLGAAVRVQCQAVNLAALYSVVAASDLLGHLDSVERLFLIAPTSDFLIAISSFLVERFVEQNKTFFVAEATISSQKTKRLRSAPADSIWSAATSPTEPLWSHFRMQEAVRGALSRSHVTSANTKYLDLAVYQLPVRESSGTATLWNPFDELCSAKGLELLKLQYLAEWPIPAIITSTTLDAIGSMTRRLLELSQLSALLRMTWAHLRVRQQYSQQTIAADRVRNGRFRLLDREINSCFRILQNTVQALFNYVSDRIHFSGKQLRERMIRSTSNGLDEAVFGIQQYARSLKIASFHAHSLQEEEKLMQYAEIEAEDDYEAGYGLEYGSIKKDPLMDFKICLSKLLNACRLSLKAFLGFCYNYSSADINEEKVTQFLSVVGGLSIRLQDLKERLSNPRLIKSLPTEERIHADVLNMYLI